MYGEQCAIWWEKNDVVRSIFKSESLNVLYSVEWIKRKVQTVKSVNVVV